MARSSVSNVSTAFCHNFLGNIPLWYKLLIVVFLVINPVAFSISPFVAGWMLIIEFIFTLAMALSCYPLQPGGLLAIEAVAIGMTTPDHVFHEISGNLEVILLLMFMVAGIHFIRALLLYVFSNVIVGIRSKTLASFIFCFSGAVLSCNSTAGQSWLSFPYIVILSGAKRSRRISPPFTLQFPSTPD